MLRKSLVPFVCTIVYILFLTACSEKEFDPNHPQKSFGIAKEPYDDENYEIALQRLGELKSRFPYSKFAAESRPADRQFPV